MCLEGEILKKRDNGTKYELTLLNSERGDKSLNP